MKIASLFTAALTVLLTPFVTFAGQGIFDGASGEAAGNLSIGLTNIIEFINQFLLPLILAFAFIVFVWGVFRFFIQGGHNDEAKESGKSLMIWGVLGFVVIVSLWGIVNFVVNAIGLQDDSLQNIPEVPTTPEDRTGN